jgi:hypothetical protein
MNTALFLNAHARKILLIFAVLGFGGFEFTQIVCRGNPSPLSIKSYRKAEYLRLFQ